MCPYFIKLKIIQGLLPPLRFNFEGVKMILKASSIKRLNVTLKHVDCKRIVIVKSLQEKF